MRQRGRLLQAAALCLAASIVFTACANTGADRGGPGGQENDSGPYRVGVLVPETGALSAVGEAMRDGIVAQADLINAAGGINGRQIELLVEDDESTPEIGVSAANNFVREEVDVILGGYASSVTLAVQPITARANLLYFVVGSQTSQMFGGADPNALRINTNSEVAGYSAARYIADSKAETVAVMFENSAYGNDATASFKAELAGLGGSKIVAEEQFETADTDFRSSVGNVKAAGADTVVTFSSQALTGQVVLMQQLSAAGMDSELFAGFGTVYPETIKLAGASANGWRSADIYYDGTPFTEYPANTELATAYGGVRNGAVPNRWAAVSAQSLLIWARAVEETDTTDPAAVAGAIKGKTFDDTIFDQVTFTDQGQMTTAVQIFEIADGKPSPLEPIEVPDKVWQVGGNG